MKINRINWTHNVAVAETLESRMLKGDRISQLEKSLLSSGIPTIKDAKTPKDDAIGLLMLASEVEHALMVQYLYSSLSLRRSYAGVIANIAVQEMGHLITVQNLLLILTGLNYENIPSLIHLGRDGLRRKSDLNPIPFILEKITKNTLGKFVVVERPSIISDPQLDAKVTKIEADLKNSNITFHPVNALYAAIRWLFQSSDSSSHINDLNVNLGFKPGWHLSEEDFIAPEIIKDFTSNKIEWGSIPGLIVEPVLNRKEALAAIDLITEQGEGILNHDDSHFYKFLSLFERFESGGIRVKDLPRSPYVKNNPGEDSFAVKIENEYTGFWAELFNIQYELLLLDIAWGISQSSQGTIRKKVIELTIEEMNFVIRPMSKDLTKKKLKDNLPINAAPPYQINDETMPINILEYQNRFDVLILNQQSIIGKIFNHEDFEMDFPGKTRIERILSINEKRDNFSPNSLNLL